LGLAAAAKNDMREVPGAGTALPGMTGKGSQLLGVDR
jgi:hypothetical protein